MTTTIYVGPVINPKSLTTFLALPACLIAVSSDGNILWIDVDVDLTTAIARHGVQTHHVVHLKPGEFIMPGFVDTHIHACQFPNLGVGGDLELLDWLSAYTFPTESKFEDLDYAERIYTDVVQRVVASGTTTCCYYGSLHRDSTMLLADIVRKKGQRAFVGKCNMNWHCPDYYVEKSVDESISATIDLVHHIRALPLSPAQEPLVYPAITPRFAISCTPELLAKLGDLAETMPNVAIQTHISENEQEVDHALRYFAADSYAGIYDRFKLLRHNTILAHGVWLTETEMDLIAEKGAGISHCPTSNFYLGSGMARVGALLDHGIKVGFGTDVSGGYSPSILRAIQMANIASKMLAIQSESKRRSCQQKHGVDGHLDTCADPAVVEHHDRCDCSPQEGRFANKKLSVATLLYLATKGGAEVCCLQDRIGSFEAGKSFDALLVSVRSDTGNPAMWSYDLEGDDSPEAKLRRSLERFLFCGDDRNIRKVFVQGAIIGGQEHQTVNIVSRTSCTR